MSFFNEQRKHSESNGDLGPHEVYIHAVLRILFVAHAAYYTMPQRRLVSGGGALVDFFFNGDAS